MIASRQIGFGSRQLADPVELKDTLRFEAAKPFSSVTLNVKSPGSSYVGYEKTDPVYLETSRDGATWTAYNVGDTINLSSEGEAVYVRSTERGNARMGKNTMSYHYFTIEGEVFSSGSLYSLLSQLYDANQLADYCFYGLFENCTGLRTAPSFPGVAMGFSSCNGTFYGCSSLVEVPDIPDVPLAPRCFMAAFAGCTGLKSAPRILPTITSEDCYNQMFSGCTALETAPEILPAAEAAPRCYASMFAGCTSLTDVSSLQVSAVRVSEYSYFSMFSGCTNLVNPPAVLPAETLGNKCYAEMFRQCTSLATVPRLPAVNLAVGCYTQMFQDCSALRIPGENLLEYENGYFSLDDPEPDPDVSGVPVGDVVVYDLLLPATTLVDGCYSGMFMGSGITQTPVLHATTLASSCYRSMFSGCTNLESIRAQRSGPEGLTALPTLRATELPSFCYSNMFSKCTALRAAGVTELDPEGAVHYFSLSESCCEYMYDGCTSLSEAQPYISADEAPESCFAYMYRGCGSLVTPTAMRIRKYKASSCRNMYEGCARLGTASVFYQTTEIEEIAARCFMSMFEGCTSVTDVPRIDIVENTQYTLPASCFEKMFKDCTNLGTPEDELSEDLKNNAVTAIAQLPPYADIHVSPGEVLLEITGGTFGDRSCACMFEGCENLRRTPVITATSFGTSSGADSMFWKCSSLTYVDIPNLTEWGEIYYSKPPTRNWLLGAAETGTMNLWYDRLGGVDVDPTVYAEVYIGSDYCPDGWATHNSADPEYGKSVTFTCGMHTQSISLRCASGNRVPLHLQYRMLSHSNAWRDWHNVTLEDVGVYALKPLTADGFVNTEDPEGGDAVLSPTIVQDVIQVRATPGYTNLFGTPDSPTDPTAVVDYHHFTTADRDGIFYPGHGIRLNGCVDALINSDPMSIDGFEPYHLYRLFAGCDIESAGEYSANNAISFENTLTIGRSSSFYVGSSACREMFKDCVYLMSSPFVGIGPLSDSSARPVLQCYENMFAGCKVLSKLSYRGSFGYVRSDGTYPFTQGWLSGVEVGAGTAYLLNSSLKPSSRNENTVPEGWEIVYNIPSVWPPNS